jgi:hypothetical protein
VLDAGEGGEPAQLVVESSTPGFTAEIRAGDSAEGPFETVVAPGRTVGARTEFPIDGDAARYYVLWITDLPGGVARVEEITAAGA